MLIARHGDQGTIAHQPLEIARPVAAPPRVLLYPDKLSFSPDDKVLAISDLNHNRVLVVAADSGRMIHRVGGGAKDLHGGSFGEARFFRP